MSWFWYINWTDRQKVMQMSPPYNTHSWAQKCTILGNRVLHFPYLVYILKSRRIQYIFHVKAKDAVWNMKLPRVIDEMTFIRWVLSDWLYSNSEHLTHTGPTKLVRGFNITTRLMLLLQDVDPLAKKLKADWPHPRDNPPTPNIQTPNDHYCSLLPVYVCLYSQDSERETDVHTHRQCQNYYTLRWRGCKYGRG